MFDVNLDVFEDIGQDNDDLEIDFSDSFELSEISDIRELEGFAYPSMLISGVKFNDTLRILRELRINSYRLFDVWIDLGDGELPIKQGTLPANSEILLAMRYLGLRVTLYLDENNIDSLDLNKSKDIEKFI